MGLKTEVVGENSNEATRRKLAKMVEWSNLEHFERLWAMVGGRFLMHKFFILLGKLAGKHEYVCNVHLSKMSPFWLK